VNLEIVANLHGCLEVPNDYQLNRDAFALHTANIRTDPPVCLIAHASERERSLPGNCIRRLLLNRRRAVL